MLLVLLDTKAVAFSSNGCGRYGDEKFKREI